MRHQPGERIPSRCARRILPTLQLELAGTHRLLYVDASFGEPFQMLSL
jgi:hypothetical protein